MSDQTSVPPTPRSPKTLRILNPTGRQKTDHLRAQFAELIDGYVPSSGHNVEAIMQALREEETSEDVWYAAMTSRFFTQDLPLVECAICDYPCMLEAFLTRTPLSAGMRVRAVEAVGQYGQTALQHSISMGSWQAASMLIRHGANCGLVNDTFGIIVALKNAAYSQREDRGSWRAVDAKLLDLFATITMIYGEAWKTGGTAMRAASNITVSVSSADDPDPDPTQPSVTSKVTSSDILGESYTPLDSDATQDEPVHRLKSSSLSMVPSRVSDSDMTCPSLEKLNFVASPKRAKIHMSDLSASSVLSHHDQARLSPPSGYISKKTKSLKILNKLYASEIPASSLLAPSSPQRSKTDVATPRLSPDNLAQIFESEPVKNSDNQAIDETLQELKRQSSEKLKRQFSARDSVGSSAGPDKRIHPAPSAEKLKRLSSAPATERARIHPVPSTEKFKRQSSAGSCTSIHPFGNPARSFRSKEEHLRRKQSDALCDKYLE